jgi:hypothetical protein
MLNSLMTLRHYRPSLDSVFCILGSSENAITESIAWVLSQCPTFLFAFLGKVAPGIKLGDVQIATQSFGTDRGFTDIEIYERRVMHVIVEAKKGWCLPQEGQFKRYLPRFSETQAPLKARFFVSMSEASDTYAGLYLPQSIVGVLLKHMNWHQTKCKHGVQFEETVGQAQGA